MKLKIIWSYINISRSIPAWIAYKLSKQSKIVEKDIDVWIKIQRVEDKLPHSKFQRLNWLLLYSKEFRNLFFNRISKVILVKVLEIFHPKLQTLYVSTKNIGWGLFISHGFSTIIVANSIGVNCWVNQQVTVGYGSNPLPPTIGNNVRIGAGAIVIGDIKVGNNSVIGAGAVVAKDVPEDCVVIGNPAIIYKRNGKIVNERL